MELLVQTIEQYRTRPILSDRAFRAFRAFVCFTDEDSLLREGMEILVLLPDEEGEQNGI